MTTFPLAVHSSGRYLVDANGIPFRVQGDSAWIACCDLTLTDLRTYLDDRQSRGFNLIIVQITNPARYVVSSTAPHCQGAGGALPFLKNGSGGTWGGDPNFANNMISGSTAGSLFDADFSSANDTYFAWIDTLLNEANSRGICVRLDFCYMGFNNGATDGWWQTLTNTQNTQTVCHTFGLYLGNRYKSFPNIIWDCGTDMFPSPGSEGETRFHKILQGIQDAGDTHLVTAHWKASSEATDEANFAADQDVNGFYAHGPYPSFGPTIARARNAYNQALGPACLWESGYEGEHGFSRAQLRFEMWGAMLGGIGGTTFGNGPIWTFDTAGAGWQASLGSDGTLDMQRVGALFDQVAWWKLVPNGLGSIGTLITAGGGTAQTLGSPGTNDGADGLDYVCAAAAPDKSLLVAYLPDGRAAATTSVTIDMTKMYGSTRARWFDPSNGAFSEIGRFPNTSTRAFAPVGTNNEGNKDWVLVLESGPSFPMFNVNMSA